MKEYNQTDILETLDGTEYFLCIKNGVLYRVNAPEIVSTGTGSGATGSFTVGGVTYTFENGIITGPIEAAP